MNYSFAKGVTKTNPLYVMKTDSRNKKNCFVAMKEVAMTEEMARSIAGVLNAEFRKTMKRKPWQ